MNAPRPRRPAALRPPRGVTAAAEAIAAHVNAANEAANLPARFTPLDAIRLFLDTGARAEYARIIGAPCPYLPPERPARPAPAKGERCEGSGADLSGQSRPPSCKSCGATFTAGASPATGAHPRTPGRGEMGGVCTSLRGA